MKKVLLIILGILLLCCGGYLMFRPIEAISVLSLMLAAALVVNGISHVIAFFTVSNGDKKSGWLLVSAIISIIFGLILLGNVFLRFAVNVTLLYIISIWFIIGGILRIFMAFDVKKLGAKNWWTYILLGILFIICGVLSFSNPAALGFTLAIFFAINMFICGIDLITLAFAA